MTCRVPVVGFDEMQRFVGEICGFGTAAGTRIVIGRWAESPFGSFADAMVEDIAGHRTLIAPNTDVGGYISEIYAFDDVIVEQVRCERGDALLRFDGGPLRAVAEIGRRDVLGWTLSVMPRRVATSPRWATIIDPIAARALRGVRTRGVTEGGEEFYGATDRRELIGARASWAGGNLGEMRPVDPPVRFGFGSTPKKPSIVTVTTTVRPFGHQDL